jgi:uncharacterized protein DUF6457
MLEDWITEVATELGIGELGELVDPELVRPLVLDMTRDVAHGVARPAAPITAYLLGLAVGRAAGAGPGEREFAETRAQHLAEMALGRSGGEVEADPAPGPSSSGTGAPADPAVGSN